eukprot:scaffold24932_cov79-Isochrysis_galbana.AAC.2
MPPMYGSLSPSSRKKDLSTMTSGVSCGAWCRYPSTRSRASRPVCCAESEMVTSTGTPVADLILSTGMRAESTSVCEVTHGSLDRSACRSRRAALMASRPGPVGTPSRVTSTSDEASDSPVEREPYSSTVACAHRALTTARREARMDMTSACAASPERMLAWAKAKISSCSLERRGRGGAGTDGEAGLRGGLPSEAGSDGRAGAGAAFLTGLLSGGAAWPCASGSMRAGSICTPCLAAVGSGCRAFMGDEGTDVGSGCPGGGSADRLPTEWLRAKPGSSARLPPRPALLLPSARGGASAEGCSSGVRTRCPPGTTGIATPAPPPLVLAAHCPKASAARSSSEGGASSAAKDCSGRPPTGGPKKIPAGAGCIHSRGPAGAPAAYGWALVGTRTIGRASMPAGPYA